MARAEVQIGDTKFYLRTFAPRDQLRIFGDLQKELLPSLGTLLAGARTDGGSGDSDAVIAAIRSFSSSLDGKGLDGWCGRLIEKELVSYERSGREPQKLDPARIDDAFDDFAQILELLYEIIKLNFAGPLARWLDLSGSGLTGSLGGLLGDSETTSKASS